MRKGDEQEIRSTLGFIPKKIVITGDSAGGNLALGLTLALNDLRTDYRTKFKVPIPMPDGLVPIYSPFLIGTTLCPSRVLSVFDAMGKYQT